MKQFKVTGMSCAACSSRVEKAVSEVDGVTSCSVNLLTGDMGVEGSASEASIIAAVEKAGYGAASKTPGTAKSASADKEDALKDRETPALVRRLVVSLVLLAALMYISMGHTMWGWPLPARLAENRIATGLIQLLLSGVIMIINGKFFVNGFKSLWHRAPNMDTLVALGSMASFVWSVVILFFMTDAQLNGNDDAVMRYSHEFYFESAAMILTLITVGKMLDEKYCIEGACPVVIDCRVRDGEHVFVTENDGTNLAKAPMGSLPGVMDNDLRQVDAMLREYWGMAPITDKEEEVATDQPD